jgi:hypothetical protein
VWRACHIVTNKMNTIEELVLIKRKVSKEMLCKLRQFIDTPICIESCSVFIFGNLEMINWLFLNKKFIFDFQLENLMLTAYFQNSNVDKYQSQGHIKEFRVQGQLYILTPFPWHIFELATRHFI